MYKTHFIEFHKWYSFFRGPRGSKEDAERAIIEMKEKALWANHSIDWKKGIDKDNRDKCDRGLKIFGIGLVGMGLTLGLPKIEPIEPYDAINVHNAIGCGVIIIIGISLMIPHIKTMVNENKSHFKEILREGL